MVCMSCFAIALAAVISNMPFQSEGTIFTVFLFYDMVRNVHPVVPCDSIEKKIEKSREKSYRSI